VEIPLGSIVRYVGKETEGVNGMLKEGTIGIVKITRRALQRGSDSNDLGVFFPLSGAKYRIKSRSLVVIDPPDFDRHHEVVEVREKHLKEITLRRQIFDKFDVDEDGHLNKTEFKEYLKGTGRFGLPPADPERRETYTEAGYDKAWLDDCESMGCNPDRGVSWKQFDEILYGTHRFGESKVDHKAVFSDPAEQQVTQEFPDSFDV